MKIPIESVTSIFINIWENKEISFGFGIPLTILILVIATIWANKEDKK